MKQTIPQSLLKHKSAKSWIAGYRQLNANRWQLTYLPIFVIMALVIAFLMSNQTPPAHSFFQSPVAPTETPTPPPPTPTPPPPPTETPSPTDDAGQEPPPPPDTAAPQDAAVPPDTSAPDSRQGTGNSGEVIPTPPSFAPLQQDTRPTAAPSSLSEETPQSVVNWAAFVDIIVQWVAWLWLCIGVGLILLIPLFFLFLQIRGKRMAR